MNCSVDAAPARAPGQRRDPESPAASRRCARSGEATGPSSTQPHAALVLSFLFFYRVGDIMMFAMSKPFLRDIGVDTAHRGIAERLQHRRVDPGSDRRRRDHLALGPGALSGADGVSCRTWRSRSTSGWRCSSRNSRASSRSCWSSSSSRASGTAAISVFQMQRCRADFSASHFAFITAIVGGGQHAERDLRRAAQHWVGWPMFFTLCLRRQRAQPGAGLLRPEDADRIGARGAAWTIAMPRAAVLRFRARRRRAVVVGVDASRGATAGDAGRRGRVRLPVHARGRGRRPIGLPALIDRAPRGAGAKARARAQGAASFLIGKSMGGRVGCHVALEETVAGVICLGYPLQSGATGAMRDEVLIALRTPILFVQGSRDSLCPLDKLAAVRARMTAPSTLLVVEGGNHSLEVSAAPAQGERHHPGGLGRARAGGDRRLRRRRRRAERLVRARRGRRWWAG